MVLRLLIATCLLLFQISDGRPTLVEEPDDQSPDVVKTFDYSILKEKGHPRLLADTEGFESLKQKVTKDKSKNPTLYKLHKEVLSRASRIVATDRSFTSSDQYYLVVDNLMSCAYAYRLTGQEKYLTKARNDMAKVCTFQSWKPGGLAIGEISFAMGIAYDWLYHDLSLEERAAAHKVMVEKGIRPMSKNNRLAKIVGNWNQINLGGVSVASLAIYEKDKAIAVQQIERALAGNRAGVKAIYSPNGNYAEGLGYWEYGGTYQACFLSCLKGIFGHTAGIAEIPGFMDSGEYALFMHGTMNTSFSYSDGGAYIDPFLLTSWWFAAQKDDPTLIYCEKRKLEDRNDPSYKYTDIDEPEQPYRMLAPILVAIRDFDMDSRPVNPPVKEVWSGRGEMPVVMVRKGWKFNGKDVYLGIKGGCADTWETSLTSHGHMDAGSFVFEAEGVRWSDDIMRPPYGRWYEAMRKAETPRIYTAQSGVMWDTFRISNLCHSTIVSYANDGSVAGKLHSTDYDVDGFASIDEVIDSAGRQGAVVNMTAPMKGQVKSAVRTVELVNGTDLVVTDEITALEGLDCPLEWRMLSISSSLLSSDSVVLTKNDQTRTLTATSSDPSVPVLYASWETARPYKDNWRIYLDYDGRILNRTIVGWTATVPAGKTVKFTTVLKREPK